MGTNRNVLDTAFFTQRDGLRINVKVWELQWFQASAICLEFEGSETIKENIKSLGEWCCQL